MDPDERRVERWGPADTEPEVLTQRLAWLPEEVLLGRPVAEAPALEIDLVALFARVWH